MSVKNIFGKCMICDDEKCRIYDRKYCDTVDCIICGVENNEGHYLHNGSVGTHFCTECYPIAESYLLSEPGTIIIKEEDGTIKKFEPKIAEDKYKDKDKETIKKWEHKIEEDKDTIKRGRGRPKLGEIVIKPIKKPKGRPRIHVDGARAFRDSKHRKMVDRVRLKELEDTEKKYEDLLKILKQNI